MTILLDPQEGQRRKAEGQQLALDIDETWADRMVAEFRAWASKRDRDEGLDGFEKRSGGFVSNTSGQHMTRRDEGYEVAPRANNHPTVKPTNLMRYLCRLVTPPGGVVLDPFVGSGSTGRGAVLEGFRFVGIEREEEYVAIARARIEHVERTLSQPEPPATMDLFSWEAA